MILGVSYNIFDGEEVLEGSIKQIRDQVDFISVVYQTKSNFGNTADSNLVPLLENLKSRGLIDKLYLRGHLTEFQFSIEIALNEASLLDDKMFLSEFMLYSARFDMLQGRYSIAKTKLDEILRIKSAIDDAYGCINSLKEIGRINWREGNVNEALNNYEKAI